MNDSDSSTSSNVPPPGFRRRRREKRIRTAPRLPKISKGSLIGYLVFLALAFIPLFIWFGCRIEPDMNEIAILTRKTGTDLPQGQILALEEKQKGLQLDILPEGRYFYNPYHWAWEIDHITDIPPGKLGVMTRLYGQNLPAGKVIAADGMKGIVADVLRPGKYRLNSYAYHIEQFDAINIRPGHVGVITSLIGDDVLNNEDLSREKNTFLVSDTRKGVIDRVLDPGTYYINPYIYNVVEVNLQSQRFEMSGDDVISFLTLDGFTVTVEGTIEFALRRDSAALLTHRVGDLDDIIKKVILPRARGFSRIEGSKYPAINFIVGETRQDFQDRLEVHLAEKSEDWGVDIKSVLVRKIIPPDQIASINRDREVAVQDANKFDQQIIQAKSKAELVKQEMLAVQNREKVEADTARIKYVIEAEQKQAVHIIEANKNLEVSRIRLEAAQHQAEGTILRAKGDRDAIKAHNQAEADVLTAQVKAFETGLSLARYQFYEKIGPQIDTVLSGDDEKGLGAVFRPFMPELKGGAQ